MKCVQVVGQGIPTRMSDDEAFCLVELMKDGEYCPKHVWREYYASRDPAAGYSKLTPGDHKWLRERGLRP